MAKATSSSKTAPAKKTKAATKPVQKEEPKVKKCHCSCQIRSCREKTKAISTSATPANDPKSTNPEVRPYRSDESDISVEKKLMALLNLQKIDTEINKIRIVRGELPLEVQDLER